MHSATMRLLGRLAVEVLASLRRLQRRPATSATGAVVLALGVAALGLATLFYDATQRQPIALPHVDELVDILATRASQPDQRFAPPESTARSWGDGARSFRSFGLYQPFGTVDLTGEGPARRLRIHRATADFFATLGVAPSLGRTFREAEESPGSGRVALLSERLASEIADSLGLEPHDLVGSRLRLDGVEHEVIGAVPGGFGVRGGVPDLWLPLERSLDGARSVGALARLRPGSSLAEAQADLASIRSPGSDVKEDLQPSVRLLSAVMREPTRKLAGLLLLVGAAVLIAAAVNFAGTITANQMRRDSERALRIALGATAGRLLGSLLTDSLVAASLGTAGGLLLLAILLPALPDLRGLLLYESISLRLGPWILGLCSAAGLGSGLLAGLLASRSGAGSAETPGLALQGSRQSPTLVSIRRQRLLAAAQIATTAALVVVAVFLVRQARRLTVTPLGFEPRGSVVAEISPSRARYPEAADVQRLAQRLEAAFASGGADALGMAHDLPGGNWGYSARRSGSPDAVEADFLMVSHPWRRALDLDLVAGRDLEASDRAGSEPVALLSESASARLFPDTVALDRPILFDGVEHRVVGVVGDARRDPARDFRPTVYVPLEQHWDDWNRLGPRSLVLVLRGREGEERLSARLRETMHRIDPELPLVGLTSLVDRLARERVRDRLGAGVVTLLAALGLALASFGLAVVLAVDFDRRQRELGIRRACGARNSDIVRWVSRRLGAPWGGGIAVGLLAGTGLLRSGSRLLSPPADASEILSVLAIVLPVLALAALAAMAWPLRRLLRTRLIDALRAE